MVASPEGMKFESWCHHSSNHYIVNHFEGRERSLSLNQSKLLFWVHESISTYIFREWFLQTSVFLFWRNRIGRYIGLLKFCPCGRFQNSFWCHIHSALPCTVKLSCSQLCFCEKDDAKLHLWWIWDNLKLLPFFQSYIWGIRQMHHQRHKEHLSPTHIPSSL